MTQLLSRASALLWVTSLVLLVTAPGARAADSFSSGRYLPAGPVALGGGRLSWAEYRSDGGFNLRSAQQRAVTLRRRPNRDPRILFTLRLVGSPQGVFSIEGLSPSKPSDDDLPGQVYGDFLTSFSGAVTRVAPRCGGSGNADFDGGVMVVRSCDAMIEVRRVGQSGSSLIRRVPETGIPPSSHYRIAGRYVAYRTSVDRTGAPSGDDVVIYDWQAGRELYRVAVPAPQLADLDLQADGKVAFSFIDPSVSARAARMQVAWASPQDPTAHKLPLAPVGSYRVKLDRDRLFFLASSTRFAPAELGDLGVTSLAGASRVLARRVIDGVFDVEADRVAYAVRTCRGPRAVRQSFAAPTAVGSTRKRCPLRLSGRLRGDRRQRVIVAKLSCLGLARDCTADRLRVVLRRRGRVQTLATARYRRGRARLRARLTRRGARLLRGRRRLRITVVARVSDSAVGADRTRRTSATLTPSR